MTEPALPSLVSTDWLAQRLGQPDLRIVDATWFLPAEQRDPAAEFAAAHIPGAVRFDIDAIADQTTSLPHMLPDAGKFARDIGALGIGSADRVVAYDRNATYAAARVWWTFRAFGHPNVAVLDGGLTQWLAEGRPTQAGVPRPAPKVFSAADANPDMVRDIGQMAVLAARTSTQDEQVIDARSNGRYRGVDPEPRPNLRFGHLPGAINLPNPSVIDVNTRKLLPVADLKARFRETGIDLSRPITAYCGSGVTAALVALAAHLAGAEKVAVYDGSWAEWGARDDVPIVR